MRGSMALLLLALLPLVGCSAGAAPPPFSERATMRLAGPVAGVRASTHVFEASSGSMQALLDDPVGWSASGPHGSADVEAERTGLAMVFDRDGWLRRSDFRWVGAQGWVISLRFGRDGIAAPSTVEVVLAPPEGSAAPVQPVGSGGVAFAEPLRQVIDYSGRHPGGGSEHYRREVLVDAEGRLLESQAQTTGPDGAIRHEWLRVDAHDAAGRVAGGLQLLRDGVEYRVSHLHLAPDDHGNPTRLLKTYRLPESGNEGPVQRAELILYEYRYDNEAG